MKKKELQAEIERLHVCGACQHYRHAVDFGHNDWSGPACSGAQRERDRYPNKPWDEWQDGTYPYIRRGDTCHFQPSRWTLIEQKRT